MHRLCCNEESTEEGDYFRIQTVLDERSTWRVTKSEIIKKACFYTLVSADVYQRRKDLEPGN
jgi:hypothetical protein